jgi:hypothetical protein
MMIYGCCSIQPPVHPFLHQQCRPIHESAGRTFDDGTQALDRAKDLLATAIEMVRDDGEALPPPPPANGRPIVEADLD